MFCHKKKRCFLSWRVKRKGLNKFVTWLYSICFISSSIDGLTSNFSVSLRFYDVYTQQPNNLCPELGPSPIRDPWGKRNPSLYGRLYSSRVHMLDARIYNIFLLFFFFISAQAVAICVAATVCVCHSDIGTYYISRLANYTHLRYTFVPYIYCEILSQPKNKRVNLYNGVAK